MSYYGAWVTTNSKAYKGKATVHCNLFAGPRTVTSNMRQRNGIAHGWRRKRRRQPWLIDTSQRLHKRHLRAVSPTQKSHAVILPWHFRYRVRLTWAANYHATTEAVAPGFTLCSLPPWQSQGRICSPFTSFVTRIVMTWMPPLGIFTQTPCKFSFPATSGTVKTEYKKSLQQAPQLTCHTTDMPCLNVYSMYALWSTAARVLVTS